MDPPAPNFWSWIETSVRESQLEQSRKLAAEESKKTAEQVAEQAAKIYENVELRPASMGETKAVLRAILQEKLRDHAGKHDATESYSSTINGKWDVEACATTRKIRYRHVDVDIFVDDIFYINADLPPELHILETQCTIASFNVHTNSLGTIIVDDSVVHVHLPAPQPMP